MSPEEVAALIERTRANSGALAVEQRRLAGCALAGKARYTSPVISGETRRVRKTRTDRERRRRAREYHARQALRWDNP